VCQKEPRISKSGFKRAKLANLPTIGTLSTSSHAVAAKYSTKSYIDSLTANSGRREEGPLNSVAKSTKTNCAKLSIARNPHPAKTQTLKILQNIHFAYEAPIISSVFQNMPN